MELFGNGGRTAVAGGCVSGLRGTGRADWELAQLLPAPCQALPMLPALTFTLKFISEPWAGQAPIWEKGLEHAESPLPAFPTILGIRCPPGAGAPVRRRAGFGNKTQWEREAVTVSGRAPRSQLSLSSTVMVDGRGVGLGPKIST